MRKKTKTEAAPFQLDLFLTDILSAVFPAPLHATDNPSQKKSQKDLSPKIRFIEGRDGKIKYELKRSKRRSIGFLINENGLRVTAPLKASLKSIEGAILDKEHWIRNKLQYFQTQYKIPTPVSLENGEKLPYLGNNLSLRLQEDTINHISLDPLKHELIIKTKNPQSKTSAKDMLTAWFQERAKEYFSHRMPYFAQKLNVRYRQFALSSAKYRWGSCSIDGNIRLNWKLVHFPSALIDYVIVHELAHLLEMNHSKRFWNIVAQVCPQFRILRNELNQQGRTLPSW